MKVAVTGATGFVGQHVVPALLDRGHKVLAVARNAEKATIADWLRGTEFVACDIHQCDDHQLSRLAECDVVIHLAWPNLPNYGELFHIEENYPADYRFLKSLVLSGARKLIVTGTCFEYGMQNGSLTEDSPAAPVTPYGMAKDFLRRSLQMLAEKHPFQLLWTRLFYMHGAGQSSNSLMAQLQAAISRGDRVFNMSGGAQLRDYLPVTEVARLLTRLSEIDHGSEIVNICSGVPISVRNLVESRLREANSPLQLNLGHFPYSPYEPFAFWGNRHKLDRILEQT